MTMLLQTYAPALIAALLIGIAVAFWAFRRKPATDAAPPKTVEVTPPPPAVEAPALEPEAPPPSVPASEGPPDDLQTLKGVGARFAARLNELGFTRFDQLAALDDAGAAALDSQMGTFQGRLARDRVIEQAGYLARGDRAGFEATFGKLGSGA